MARQVLLVDPDEGKARGKALDITQSGPVEGYDTRVEGCAAVESAQPFDVLVVADWPDVAGETLPAARAGDLARTLIPAVGRGLVLVAGPHAPVLVEAFVRRGFPRERVVGSLPVAAAAALCRRLAEHLSVEPSTVSLGLLGNPPEHVVVPQGSATAGGIPVERIGANAVRRAVAAGERHALGPVALAHAARRVLWALDRSRGTILPVYAWLDGEYGHRGVALAVPVLLGKGGAQRVVDVPLDPVDRVALDTAAQRREEAR